MTGSGCRWEARLTLSFSARSPLMLNTGQDTESLDETFLGERTFVHTYQGGAEVVSSQRGSQRGQPLPRPPLIKAFLVTATRASAEPQTSVVLPPQS